MLLNDGHGHFHDLPSALPPKPWGDQGGGLAVVPIELNGDGRIDLLAKPKKKPKKHRH